MIMPACDMGSRESDSDHVRLPRLPAPNSSQLLNTTMVKNINRSIEERMGGIKKKTEEFDTRMVELNQKIAVFEDSISGI